MPFAYYARLGPRQKAIYRKSDGVSDVPLPDAGALKPLATELEAALGSEDRRAVQRTATRLVFGLCDQLGVPRVRISVLAARPRSAESELYGLYLRDDESDLPPLIRVWMRTSAQRKVVRFRTFLRTLLHEVCHHLDYDLFRFEDSMHTEGFFRRESSLARQLISARVPARELFDLERFALTPCEPRPPRAASALRPKPRKRRTADPRQLELPF